MKEAGTNTDKFIFGERYRVTNHDDWKDEILYYVGESVLDKGQCYFEIMLKYFHLDTQCDLIRIPIKDYNFINVSKEEEMQKLEIRKKELQEKINSSQQELNYLNKEAGDE